MISSLIIREPLFGVNTNELQCIYRPDEDCKKKNNFSLTLFVNFRFFRVSVMNTIWYEAKKAVHGPHRYRPTTTMMTEDYYC